MKNFIIFLIAILTIAACQKEELIFSAEDTYIHVTIEDVTSTKTYLDSSNNIRWSEYDQIAAYMKSSLLMKYQVLPSSVGKTSASFEKIDASQGTAQDWNHNVLYYPYSYLTRVKKSDTYYIFTVSLPSEQTYAAESFGNQNFPMVAVCETDDLTFRNVLGGIKLQFKGNQKIASITIQGKDDEKLSGAATIRGYMSSLAPSITLGSTSSSTVTLNCGSDGVQLKENAVTDFIIALPPLVFDMGFKVTVKDTDNKTYVISTDKSNTVNRSSLLVMPEVTLEAKRKLDYVDEYGVNHGPGVRVGETVWAPVNCGYHVTDFKYGKLYQWGRKFGQGYDESDASIPSIEAGTNISASIGNGAAKSNVFFTSTADFKYDWLSSPDGLLWNTGSEMSPIKTDYDPCPKGWRVPTRDELKMLSGYKMTWGTNDAGQYGYWFADSAYEGTEDARLFLLASGLRSSKDGSISNRFNFGYYWSSMPYNVNYSTGLFIGKTNVGMTDYQRANGLSVRCVQE